MPQNTYNDNQHWFSEWIGAVGQEAIIWAKIEPNPYRHLASL